MMCQQKTTKKYIRYVSLFFLGTVMSLPVPGLNSIGIAQSEPVRMDRNRLTDENRFMEDPAPEKQNVHLYFATRDNSYLTAEQRGFMRSADPVKLSRLIIETLIKGPRLDLMPTLPAQAVLNAFYVGNDGTAYVDFSESLRQQHPGGVQSERLTIFSIVNSLIMNVPEIATVKILIGGQDTRTLAGHIDLRYPLKADMLLIR